MPHITRRSSLDAFFLDAMDTQRARSSLSLSRSEPNLSFCDGESESESDDDECGSGPNELAPATTPSTRSSPFRTRTRSAVPRRGSRHFPAALRSWQRSVAVPESTFSSLEAKRRQRGSAHRSSPPWFVSAPDSAVALVFTLLCFFLTLTHVALLTPIFVAFDAPTRLGGHGSDPWPWEAVVDFAVGVFFLAALLNNFRTGVLITSSQLGRRAVVMAPNDIASVYVTHGTFISEAVAVIPLVAQCAWSLWLASVARDAGVDKASSAHVATAAVRLCRLMLLTRLRKLFGTTVGDAESVLTGVTDAATSLLLPVWLAQTSGEFLLLINTCASLFIATARLEPIQHSWLAADRFGDGDGDPTGANDPTETADFADLSKWDVYVAAVYWATATVSTVGYGDVAAVTLPERLVATAVMIVGSTWFAYLVGAIAALVNSHGAAAIRRAAYREKMIALRCFLDRHPSVPKTLRTRLVTFFSDTWIRKMKTNNDRALLNDLPEALRRETRFRALEGDLRLAFGGKAATAQNKESEEDAGEEDGKRGQVSEKALRAVADALVCRIVSPGTKFHIASTFVMVNEGELVVTLGGGFDFESPATPGLVTRRATNSLLEASVKSGDSRDRFVVCRGTARAHSIGVEAFCSPLDRVAARRTQNVLSCVASSETEVYEMDAARAARLGGEFPDLRKGAVVALGLVDPETNRNDSLT